MSEKIFYVVNATVGPWEPSSLFDDEHQARNHAEEFARKLIRLCGEDQMPSSVSFYGMSEDSVRPRRLRMIYKETIEKWKKEILEGPEMKITETPADTFSIIVDIAKERRSQDIERGPQDCPFAHWLTILVKKLGDVMAWGAQGSEGGENFRHELIQAAAILAATVECGDRNGWFE